MEIINVTAPIPIDELKKYFANKDTFFVIDYQLSEIKGQKLLTYLSNLDLPVDVVNFDNDFIKDYFHSPSLVSLPSIEMVATQILLEMKNLIETNAWTEFINDNKEILSVWKKKLDSLTLFNLYTVDDEETKNYIKSFPEDPTKDLEGINFVSLLKHEIFYLWYGEVEDSTLTYFSSYFNDYMFKGKNLFAFWATLANPMHVFTVSIASGEVDPKEYLGIREAALKEELNDPLI